MKKNSKGITLITLVIAIILILILTSIAIINTIGDKGFIVSANESKFKEDITALHLEFERKMLAKSVIKNFKREDVYLDETIGDLSEYMESLKNNKYSKYKQILCINAGELCGKFDKATAEQKEWLQDLGVDSTYLEISNSSMWEISNISGTENYSLIKYLGPNGDGKIKPDETIVIPNKIVNSDGIVCKIVEVNDIYNLFNKETNICNTLVISSDLKVYCSTSNRRDITVSKLVINDNVETEANINISLNDFGDIILKDNINYASRTTGNINNFIAGDNCKLGYVNGNNYQMSKLNNIKLGNNVRILGSSFQYYENVENVKIGKGLKIISAPTTALGKTTYAFNMADNCNFNIESFSEVFENALRGCQYLKTVVLEDGGIINDRAFADCTNITKVIGKNDVTIKNNAFYNCLGLKKIELGDNCNFNSNDFQGENLEKIKLGNNAIIYSSFSNLICDEFIVGDNLGDSLFFFKNSNINNITIGKNAKILKLINNSTVGTITIGKNSKVSNISDENCYVNNLILSDGIEISTRAMQNLNLKNLTIGNITTKTQKLSSGTYNPFTNCIGPENVTVLDNAGENFATELFEGNEYIKKVVIGNNVTIPNYMFRDCTNLENIKIGENADLGSNSFAGCSLLSNLTLGKNSELKASCFSKCIGLTKVIVPEGCTLYQNAIANCADEETGKGLKEVVLEKNVKIHLTYALRGNTYLEKVTIKKPLLFGDGSTSGRSLFTGDNNLNTIYTDYYTWEELQALKNFNNWGIAITKSMLKPLSQ